MRPLYHEISNPIEIFRKQNNILPPHLHKYLECIYVTDGHLQLGIGERWVEMGPQDLAVIFPDTIHQFHAAPDTPSQAIYLLGTPALAGSFSGILQKYDLASPVIPRERVHPDIPYALNTLLHSGQSPCLRELQQAYFQILLARALPFCRLTEKEEPEVSSLTWQTVSYISEHFREELSLSSMARQLGISPYKLSRIFSGIFHMNFNQYLNEIRLDYASQLLRTTDLSVTHIFMAAGFSSQTTFNRTFQTKYHVSPRVYRRQNPPSEKSRQYPCSFDGQKEKEGKEKKKEAAHNRLSGDSPWQLATGRFLL